MQTTRRHIFDINPQLVITQPSYLMFSFLFVIGQSRYTMVLKQVIASPPFRLNNNANSFFFFASMYAWYSLLWSLCCCLDLLASCRDANSVAAMRYMSHRLLTEYQNKKKVENVIIQLPCVNVWLDPPKRDNQAQSVRLGKYAFRLSATIRDYLDSLCKCKKNVYLKITKAHNGRQRKKHDMSLII